METQSIPVNIFISSNSSNDPVTMQAMQKTIQEALEKFQGKAIVHYHIKNLHTGPVGKNHPVHPWAKFGHRRGPHHFKGPHGHGHIRERHGHFRERHGHPHWRRWGWTSEVVPSGQENIEELPGTIAINEDDRNSKSNDDRCLVDQKSADEGKSGEEKVHEEELRTRFDNMDVTKSV